MNHDNVKHAHHLHNWMRYFVLFDLQKGDPKSILSNAILEYRQRQGYDMNK